jgi:O-antigen ligase
MQSALIAGGVLALCGVVMSASRGALATLMVITILWAIMCLPGTSRSKIRVLAFAFFTIVISYCIFEFIVKETYLGTRFSNTGQTNDTSTAARIDLILIGIRLFVENPVMGCGIGQFGIASATGRYAHNEFAEVISSTGTIGTILYYSVYVMAWRRLTLSLRYLQSPLFRYRINIARVLLLVLLFSGFIFRINFIQQDSMFLIAIVIGMAYWGEQQARLAYEGERENYRQESPKCDRHITESSSLRLEGIGDNSSHDKCNSLCMQIEDSAERRRQ